MVDSHNEGKAALPTGIAAVRAHIARLPAEHQKSVETYATTIRDIMHSEDPETELHMILAITLLYAEIQEQCAEAIKRDTQ